MTVCAAYRVDQGGELGQDGEASARDGDESSLHPHPVPYLTVQYRTVAGKQSFLVENPARRVSVPA